MVNDVMTASTEIFLSVIIDGAAIASVILALVWVIGALENVLTKTLKGGGDKK